MWKNCNIKTPDGKFKVTGPNNSQSEECNVNKCDAYDRENGKNVKKTGENYTDACDSAQLPTCTQWKKKGSTWATTGPNGEFCNVAALPIGSVFSKLNEQLSEANVNMDKATYPLQRHPSGVVYATGNYDQYYGGKRRRKSRKSRR